MVLSQHSRISVNMLPISNKHINSIIRIVSIIFPFQIHKLSNCFFTHRAIDMSMEFLKRYINANLFVARQKIVYWKVTFERLFSHSDYGFLH